MIVCKNCNTAQMLHIVSSRIYYQDGETPTELEEYYQCTICGSEGHLEIWTEKGTKRTSIRGDIVDTVSRPRAEI